MLHAGMTLLPAARVRRTIAATGLDGAMDDGHSGPARYRCGDLELDVRARRLLRGGAEVALEPKAYAVLQELLRHHGEVVARDALLDSVWGHRHVTPAVLNRIIALLRRAMGDDADHPHLIRTVHGVGYAFIGAPVQVGDDAREALRPPAPLDAASSVAASAAAGIAASSNAVPTGSRRRVLAVATALAVFAAALALVLIWPGLLPSSSPPPRSDAVTADAAPAVADATPLPVRSVAVLPLVDAVGDADRQFFADGLSESLITMLSQYDDLKVIGRGSSFLFRGKGESPARIGAWLGVAHLVEGSVRRDGDDVRVSIELIRAADGSVVWTRRFDRPYRNLFALQDEIALAVAGALQVKVLHAMPSMIETGRPSSGNLDAYEAYLRATAEMGAGGDVARAIASFERATRIDPGYAQAWSWLGFARTQSARGEPDRGAARAGYAQAREAIETALRLEPDFGQAHAILANLLATADHDWNGALAEFRIALSLVPDNDPSHGAVSRLLSTLGKVDEAIVERRKYIAGDPLASFARVYLANLLASVGRLDEAEANLHAAIALDPQPSPNVRDWYADRRSYLAILRGDAATALAEADSIRPGSWRDSARALALQIGADRPAADAALAHLAETGGQAGTTDAYHVARAYALRGDADATFAWLHRSLDRDESGIHYALFEPLLLRFRDDERFAAYCRQAALPPPETSEALDLDAIRTKLAKP